MACTGLYWTLRGATSWRSHRQGPCQAGGQSWDTEPHNTLCCPSEGDPQATPPRPGRGSACRAGAAVTPSCHQPCSAFLGFLQCTKHVSLLDVLVTALGGPGRPAQDRHCQGALPAPAVPGLQDAVTLLCYTPGSVRAWHEAVCGVRQRGQGCPNPDHPTTCTHTPRASSECPSKQQCQRTEWSQAGSMCRGTPSLVPVIYEPLTGDVGCKGWHWHLPRTATGSPSPSAGARRAPSSPWGFGEAFCPSPSV